MDTTASLLALKALLGHHGPGRQGCSLAFHSAALPAWLNGLTGAFKLLCLFKIPISQATVAAFQLAFLKWESDAALEINLWPPFLSHVSTAQRILPVLSSYHIHTNVQSTTHTHTDAHTGTNTSIQT